MQLLEISLHKCLVSCLDLHLKAGLRPNSLCNSLPESYRTFLVHPEEGRTLSPSTTGDVMGIEMPVLGLSEDLLLPAISAVYQSWIAAGAGVIKQLSYPIFLLDPTSFTSHHELSIAQALGASDWAPHQLPISAGLCNCSSAKHCCFWEINARMAAAQRETCKYSTFGRQLRRSYICTFVPSPSLGLPHGTAAKMHLKD